jgi:hypothetical protein
MIFAYIHMYIYGTYLLTSHHHTQRVKNSILSRGTEQTQFGLVTEFIGRLKQFVPTIYK